MSVINSDSVRAGASGAVAGYLIEQSCRFNDDDSAFLSRTPRVTGNQRTWTFSAWVKRGKLGTSSALFSAGATGDSDTNHFNVYFNSDTIWITSGATNFLKTTQVFRDPSAWFHVVVAVDTTSATADNRIRLYINGTEVTVFSARSNPAQNLATVVNLAGEVHVIGKNASASLYLDTYLADVHLIDGQQLAATSFGETDDNGQWVPIEYAATDESDLVMTYEDSLVSSTNATAYTFSSADLGTADANRYIVVAISTHKIPGRTVSSVVINGVTANVGIKQGNAADEDFVQIAWAHVPDDATGDIVITYSAVMNGTGIGIYRIIGEPHLHDIDGVGIVGTAGQTNVNTVSGGVIINVTHNSNTASFSYTGITERYDEVEDGSHYHSGASDAVTTGAAQVSVLATCSASSAIAVQTISFAPGKAYGTNGFRLDFANSSHFGKDVKTDVANATVTATASAVDSSNATTYTFSSQSIGTAHADRLVVVGVSGVAGPSSVSSMTVGGNACTVIAATDHGEISTELWGVELATGTSEDIIVTMSQGQGSLGISVYAVQGAGQMFETFSDETVAAPTGTIDCPAGGVIIGYSGINASSSPTYSWTGITENVDQAVEGSATAHSSASLAFSSKQTNLTVTADPSVTPSANYVGLVVASWNSKGTNNFLDSGLTTADSVTDAPSDSSADDIGNFCTWNPLSEGGNSSNIMTYSEGNLTVVASGGFANTPYGTILTGGSGKFYFEVTATNIVASGNDNIGVASKTPKVNDNDVFSAFSTTKADGFGYSSDGDKTDNDGTTSTYGDAYTDGDIIGVAIDLDNTAIYFSKNGTYQDSGDPTSGASKTGAAFTDVNAAGGYTPCASAGNGGYKIVLNCGQQAFNTAAPSGYVTICTANLTAPAITDPSKFYQEDNFTGTGGELVRTYTDAAGGAVSPDLSMVKDTDGTGDFNTVDSTRGATKEFAFGENEAASTVAEGIKSFDSSGITLGTDSAYNASSSVNSAYNWVEGVTPGFEISSYTGSAAEKTITHSLGAAPACIWIRNITDSVNVAMYHQGLNGGSTPEDFVLEIGATAEANDATAFFDYAPTSSNFKVGASNLTNGSSDTIIAYIFAEVPGFSSFGNYLGNANADGPFIYMGFRPAFVLTKRRDGSAHQPAIFPHNNPAAPYNPTRGMDTVDGESFTGTSRYVDFLSNGMKIRTADNTCNGSGFNFVYCAFAEFPFGGDGVAQARAK